jgi:hypothetical protein
MSRNLIGTIGLAACIACVGGCGSNGDERAIRATVVSLRQAYLTEDYRSVCAHMSAHARYLVGTFFHQFPTKCRRDLAESMSAAVLSVRDRAAPEIRDIAVDGTDADVLILLGNTTPITLRFVKDNGTWKLNQVFGTTAPPAPDF